MRESDLNPWAMGWALESLESVELNRGLNHQHEFAQLKSGRRKINSELSSFASKFKLYRFRGSADHIGQRVFVVQNLCESAACCISCIHDASLRVAPTGADGGRRNDRFSGTD